MSETVSATELASQYTAQVTADLERNTKEQERIGAEIASLQEQLAALEHDHSVLVSIQQAIDAAPVTAPAAQPTDSVAVPAPRKKAATSATSGTSGTSKRTQKTQSKPKKTASGVTRKAEKTAAPKRASATEQAAPADTAQPTLVDLVRRHLTEQKEPRSAAEITTALGLAHPERTIKTTVVRTTLEGLVAKTQAQRSKQGSSVFYTATEAAEPTTAAQRDEQAPLATA
ncbi:MULTISPECIES: hypothetical protein [unclassified Streptomyces]|uniref:hypothetical protein n=1 Tax=unclassified Streptomyces TaxID=2593676 RepID=UPI0033A37350